MSALTRPRHFVTAAVQRSGVLVLIGPGMAVLIAFLAIPFLAAIGLSLTNQRFVSPLPTRFVGLENYTRILEDPRFIHALTNNVVFALIVPAAQTTLGLGLALMVNQRLPAISIFRAIYFAPVVMVLTVVAVVWRLMLAQSGLINAGIGVFSGGSFPLHSLPDPHLGFSAIMIMSILQNVGFQMILLLAGLQAISAQVYEAGRVDCANAFRPVWPIHLPPIPHPPVFFLTVPLN